jgi:uncharacterized protein (DUF58 family)
MTVAQALRLTQRADELQQPLPAMLVEAQRTAATLLQGIHGRKRAGPGETFWQYRPYGFGDSTQRIDWRKSARASQVYIRENEWEAANSLWLWASPAPSMAFSSHLASVTKRDRACVMALALASLALRAHERVAIIGTGERPSQSRSSLLTMARHLVAGTGDALPSPQTLVRNSAVVLFGDFLDPVEDIARSIRQLAGQGVSGHMVQVNDPAEETLPYEGRIQFLGLGQPLKFIANKTEELRAAYVEKFAAHRAALKSLAGSVGWTFTHHHTDQSPAPLLMSLHMRLSERP